MIHAHMAYGNSRIYSQENEKSSVKLWQRVLNFLNRYSWTPSPLPSAKPTVPVGSQKDIKKESKADRGGPTSGAGDEMHRIAESDVGIAASAAPKSVDSNGAPAQGKLIKVESAAHDSSGQASALTNSSTSVQQCNGLKVETAIAMQTEATSNAELHVVGKVVSEPDTVMAETSQATPLSNDHHMEDASTKTIVKSEGTDMSDRAPCDSTSVTHDLHNEEKEREKPIDLTEDAAETRVSQADSSAIVHSHENAADSLAQDGLHLQSDGGDAKANTSALDNTAMVDSRSTDAGSEKGSVIPPRAPDTNMLAVTVVADGCDGSASESGTPRLAQSREPSDANLGGADCASRESTEPVVATLLVSAGSAASSKSEKSRKESKSKSEKNGKGKTAHELVVLIVEVCETICLACFVNAHLEID
jgi:hypothetical protein